MSILTVSTLFILYRSFCGCGRIDWDRCASFMTRGRGRSRIVPAVSADGGARSLPPPPCRRVAPLSLASLSCWWWQTRTRDTLGHRSPFRSLGLVCRPTPNLNSCPGRPLERPIPLNKDRPHDGATTNHRRRCRQELDRRLSPRQRQSRAHRQVETRPSRNELLHGSCRAPGTRSSCSKLRAAASAR